ncbi:MAG: ABC transporter ATP-binding protein [Lachnospiraceae bacterium]|nr:ABC transporter ATP-binding protein [Lachnospiraceae bacterium]MBP3295065.1 ABC transporter ATP-binding protein [Lachnospiraceae bacterium]
MSKILEVLNAEKYYGNKASLTKALDDLSFAVEDGEFVGIMGASGSGKTTLLNCISTIDQLSAGKVLIDGEEIHHLKGKRLDAFRSRKLGFIFQDFNLLDTMTAKENISLALSIKGTKPDEMDEKVTEIAQTLGIEDVLEKFPSEMSGGQKQRVAAARAVVTDPKLVLADEPTGALDSKASKALMESLLQLNTELGSTILMVTHDAFSASYAGRIIFIKDGKLFTEIVREEGEERKDFFKRIVDVTTVLGGELDELI